MTIPRFRPKTLLRAGYTFIPPHCDRKGVLEEWVRKISPGAFDFFPRYHFVRHATHCDLHYDRFAQHGKEYEGSIETEGELIRKELARIKNPY